jgi:hypothetical protein
VVELRDVVVYTSVGVVLGLALSVLVIPYTAMVFVSPVFVGVGFVAFLAVGIAIGRSSKPRMIQPKGRAYPLSVSEVGMIIEMAMKSIKGGEK